MTNKVTNPFELRLEMLKMAKDYLDNQQAIARDAAMQSWHAAVSFAEKMNQELPKMPELPKMYGIEEITKMADKFNEFVSGVAKK